MNIMDKNITMIDRIEMIFQSREKSIESISVCDYGDLGYALVNGVERCITRMNQV